MRLVKARIQNYRSIRDTGVFEIEDIKTIFVGPNEAGKTAILQALQRINPPESVKPFNALRDYPRALYNDIATKKVLPADIVVATAWFRLDEGEQELLPDDLKEPANLYVFHRYLDNSFRYGLTKPLTTPTYGALKADLLRLAAHLDRAVPDGNPKVQAAQLSAITTGWSDNTYLGAADLTKLHNWLTASIPLIDEDNQKEVKRRDKLDALLIEYIDYTAALAKLKERMPKFILFSNIFRVRPNIHLSHLASRLTSGVLDDDQYDYGNSCLLKLLGFRAEELSKLGSVAEPGQTDVSAIEAAREQLDSRSYQLNAASIKLSAEIRKVWNPNEMKQEASKLRLVADGQYLKVVVEDSEGVEVELDQRSEGFQWLVSFFIVFFAEAEGKHANAILLLDEPGVSLHALKQRDFRTTVSRLAALNQTIYTTHSPFMVGPDELDLVRVVELTDRAVGTKVHTSVTSNDPAALLPLQEALGYDLAQSLFAQQRNLILEGLTDLWYLEATAALLSQAEVVTLNGKIALVPSNTASKVVYFATILVSHNLKVAALLDSDNAGDQAAKQDLLVRRLGAKRILRTADYTDPHVPKAEIEDLLRETLAGIAKRELGIDVTAEIGVEPDKPIVDLLSRKIPDDRFKYKLAKAYIRWTRDHSASDLGIAEQKAWKALITAVNSALE